MHCPDDWILGYYIHSCQKMRYKANFRPQYILGRFPCLGTLLFVLRETHVPRLTLYIVSQTLNPATGIRWMVN